MIVAVLVRKLLCAKITNAKFLLASVPVANDYLPTSVLKYLHSSKLLNFACAKICSTFSQIMPTTKVMGMLSILYDPCAKAKLVVVNIYFHF